MVNTDRLYIGGQWVVPLSTERIAVENPYTEETVARVPACGAADVDRAVRAAREAFPAWSAVTPADRAAHLKALQRELAVRSEEMAALITAEMGSPRRLAERVQVGLPLMVLGETAAIVEEFAWSERIGNSLVVREPVGVVGAITPWNYPLHQTVAKLAPALAAGCAFVLKPSEVAPLSAFLLAEVVDSVGFPPGVFNIVTGTGPDAGEPLVGHPLVDMVSFTGSTRAGTRVSELAAGTVKKVALELGGKSAGIILDDADLAASVKAVVANCMLNSGQTCTALTRMLVPRARYDEAVALAAEAAARAPMGDPADPGTRVGPLASAPARVRVLGYLAQARREGAVFATGGPDARVPEQGHFVAPTVLAGVDPSSAVAREEIFGPVLTVLGYDDEDDAVRIANDSDYGLSGGVWSGDTDRALAVARRLRTGQVSVNNGQFNPAAPFGGYRRSGTGRELGRFGLEEFCEVKAVQLP
ncbi:aldehyde dehydrogenase family protein [Actinorugispora endophytica]|uniref:Betaine-aldehyde dehydrogenase n=1 Tax=Actinorugispora endophytica TaxID=1605990 RepID=A0A4V3D6Y0_9ACTN|nr:aldehyde dehydrogenase family protein [Actinorugispora endophytica]TDQ45737.1 betaine-aldehyde dehydrogenase [Actinorugispora endophytica]